ncbi:hypothetical protein GP486_008625 [Trichoglossum hirsutum]|uniref:Uncharacterized protein n=1 Tax=Trichoglossum hirsutum TaxID=265104 RepID=A0A9P8L143_9PEZI|nr:hypothetical protein GP486_008625 [Trichoglossum hirsutum]
MSDRSDESSSPWLVDRHHDYQTQENGSPAAAPESGSSGDSQGWFSSFSSSSSSSSLSSLSSLASSPSRSYQWQHHHRSGDAELTPELADGSGVDDEADTPPSAAAAATADDDDDEAAVLSAAQYIYWQVAQQWKEEEKEKAQPRDREAAELSERVMTL